MADAVVAAVHDGVAQNVAWVTSRPEPFTLTTAIGNHVILDLGGGRYALYLYLQPRQHPGAAGRAGPPMPHVRPRGQLGQFRRPAPPLPRGGPQPAAGR